MDMLRFAIRQGRCAGMICRRHVIRMSSEVSLFIMLKIKFRVAKSE